MSDKMGVAEVNRTHEEQVPWKQKTNYHDGDNAKQFCSECYRSLWLWECHLIHCPTTFLITLPLLEQLLF